MTNLVSMPTEIIPYLRKTIEQTSGEEEANFAVYQLGREWGKETARMSGEECTMDELATKATLTAVHSGLTNLDIDVGETISVTPYESKIDDRFFLGGFLSGVVSEFLDEDYVAKLKDGYFELIESSSSLEEELSKAESKMGRGESPKDLDNGESYLIIDDVKRAPITFNLFLDAVEDDVPGLCFTRIFPPKIREKFAEEDFPIFWLSTVDGAENINTIKPKNFQDRILKIISAFLKSQQGIFMIHGLEYLISNNEFKDVLNFIQQVRDTTSVNDGIFLLSVDPKAMDDKDFNSIKSELKVYNI